MNLFLSRGGSNDNMIRKWVIKNILKENSTYRSDGREKPLLSLTQSGTLHPFLVRAHLRLCRRELSRYMSHEGESICRGDTPTESNHHDQKMYIALEVNVEIALIWCCASHSGIAGFSGLWEQVNYRSQAATIFPATTIISSLALNEVYSVDILVDLLIARL